MVTFSNTYKNTEQVSRGGCGNGADRGADLNTCPDRRAQEENWLSASIPPILVLYSLHAQACNPAPGLLEACSQHSDADIVELVIGICFKKLNVP